MAEIITSAIEIPSGIISSGLTVDTGGEVTVLSGGTVTDAEAINYGWFWVEEGGHIRNIRLTNSGDAMVDGGSAENLTMESAGQIDLFAGTLRSGTIRDKGVGVIYAGGSAYEVAVSAGGRYLVYGGYAENTVVSSGGSFMVQISGGLADKNTIEAGGRARITSDGQMRETTLNGGRLDVISGRILATTLNGGELHVSSGGPESGSGCAENTVVNAGKFIVSGATATDTTLTGGEFIVSGGTAQNTTVSGGNFIASATEVQSTTVTGGEFIVSGGTAQNTTASGGAFIASGAEVQSTTVRGGAVRFIGGFADKTDLFSGTVLVSGGTVQNTTLGSSAGGGSIIFPINPYTPFITTSTNIFSSGTTGTATYGTGGSIILDGGATVYTPEQRETIGYTGNPVLAVNADALPADTEDPACRLDIQNGGLAVSTTVNSGLMLVFEGGAANETTVKGGTLHISGGGIANGITMSSGGGGGSIIIYPSLYSGNTVTYGDADVPDGPLVITPNDSSGTTTPFVTVFEGGAANDITVNAGLLTLSGGTANDVTLAGGTFHITDGGIANKTAVKGGTLSVLNGGCANDVTQTGGRIQVESGTIRGATVTGGTMRIMEGGTLSGAFTVTTNADAYMESGSVIAFDITGMTPGAEAESSGLYSIWGTPSFTLTVSDIQAAGVYALAAEAAGFRDAITVQSQFGEDLGTLTVGNTVLINNQYYTLRVTDNMLNLTVSNEAPARMWDPMIVFVNDAWASLPDGSTVEPVAGISATIGVDAFAAGRDAANAVAGNGIVVVAGGEASFQYGITRETAAWYGASVTGSTVLRNGSLTLHAGSTGNGLTVTRDGRLAVSGIARDIKVQKGGTLTVKSGGVCSDVDISASGTLIVEEGGYLTGTGNFAYGSSITVNGTINFNLTGISAGSSALFACNNVNILGAPNFTITGSDTLATGEYALASGFSSGLDGFFTLLNVWGEAIGTLTVGSGTLINGRVYMLAVQSKILLAGTSLSLTIADWEETNILYVNSDWADLENGAMVDTPSGVSFIGIDAFGDLRTAGEHLTENSFISIQGGTYASETISAGITMEGGTITGSVITETGTLTLNNSAAAANLTVTGGLFMQSWAKAADLTVSGRLVMSDSSEAENITVTGNLVLNGNSKAKNLTANEGAVVRIANGAKLLGTVTIGSGAALTGSAQFENVSELVIDGVWNFDISAGPADGALFKGDATVSGTPDCVITVSDSQALGFYLLANGLQGLPDTFRIVNTAGTELGTLSVGESIVIGQNKYTLNLSDSAALNLTVLEKNTGKNMYVYVNSDWADLEFGTVVNIPDVGNAIYGFNAFSELSGVSDYVTENGLVTVTGGLFTGVEIDRNVLVSGGTVADSAVTGKGALTLRDGAAASGITVSAGNLLTLDSGATLTVTSPEFFRSGGVFKMNGGLVCFDLSGSTAGDPAYADAGMFSYGVSFGAVLDETVRSGRYTLLSGVNDYDGSFLLRTSNQSDRISLGQETSWTYQDNGIDVTITAGLELSDDSSLQLVVNRNVSSVSLNSAWEGLEYGTVIEGTGVYGVNAFSTMEEAWNAVGEGRMPFAITILGGTFMLPETAGDISIPPPNPTAAMTTRRVYLSGGMLENSTIGKNIELFVSGDGVALKDIVVDGDLTLPSDCTFSVRNITVNGKLNLSPNENSEYSNITVVKGGTLSSGGTFTENIDITVNGTLEFKKVGLVSSDSYWVYSGFSNIKGTPSDYVMTLPQNMNNDKHLLLAEDVTDFTGSISIYDSRSKKVGNISLGKTILNNYLFDLYLSNGELRLDISYSKSLLLNPEWEGLENGTVISVPNGPLVEEKIIGVDAFGNADAALAAANGIHRISVGGSNWTFSFANVLDTVFLARGSTVYDSTIASTLTAGMARNITVLKSGKLSASIADSITVKAGGSLEVSLGNTLTGFCSFEEGAYVYIYGVDPIYGAPVLDFDVTLIEAGGETPLYQGLSRVQFYKNPFGPPYRMADVRITVSAAQEDGVYLLATGAEGFDMPYIVRTEDGTVLGTLTAGKKSLFGGVQYLVKETDGNLTLSIKTFVPPETVYLSSAWSKLEDDTVVEVFGGTAVIGEDAFGNAASAVSAAVDGTKLFIVEGSYSVANLALETTAMNGASVHHSAVEKSLSVEAGASAWDIQVAEGAVLTVGPDASAKNLIVSAGGSVAVAAGGKLTGWAVFVEGANVTVDGTLDFDISALTSGSAALYEGLGYVRGDISYTLTVRAAQTPGTYCLGYGAYGFSSAITLTGTDGTVYGTLEIGKKSHFGGAQYLVKETDGTLTLTVRTFVPPETVYLGSAWSELDEDTVVEVPGGTAVIGENAFGTAESAMSVAADGTKLFIVEGSHSIANITLETVALNGSTVHHSIVEKSLSVEAGASTWEIQVAEGGVLTVEAGASANTLTVSAGGKLTVGAGASANNLTVSAGGTLTVEAGALAWDIQVAGGTAFVAGPDASVYNLMVSAGGTLTIAAGASAWGIQAAEGANITVGPDASAMNLVVSAGGKLAVAAGGKLTGWAVFAEGSDITVDGTLDFDISALTAGAPALYEGLRYVQGNTSYTITVCAAQTPGTYCLAHGADGFKSAITLTGTDGTALGMLWTGLSIRIGDALYSLNLDDDGILSLSVAPVSSVVNTRSDVDGNGVSDVLFQHTGGNNQTGFWMNGMDTWRSENLSRPAEWTPVGSYDMDGDGLADTLFIGNIAMNGVNGTYIGYYKGGIDTDENWVNIDCLENEAGLVWRNKIGNLTGNIGRNSIVWHCAELGALGVWTDGTNDWTALGAGFDSNWTMVGCGDFDGDGRDSVVMSYMGGVKYYAIGIDGSAVDMGNLNWAGWDVHAIGDFAGDGRDDMVLFHKETGVTVLLADGDLNSYTVLGQLDAKDWFIVGAGDYNGDQKDDLLVRQYSTGMLGYYDACDVANGWVEMGRGVDMNWTVIA